MPKSMNHLTVHSQPTATLECCGEDSFAIVENEYQLVLAVADGVGGWRSKGIDPSQFSRGLMRCLMSVVKGGGSQLAY